MFREIKGGAKLFVRAYSDSLPFYSTKISFYLAVGVKRLINSGVCGRAVVQNEMSCVDNMF